MQLKKKGVVFMQIAMQELETTLEKYDDIEEPIIVKRKNKKDVIIISIEEYEEKILHAEIAEKLKKSEDDIKNGRVKKADEVFKELRARYLFYI